MSDFDNANIVIGELTRQRANDIIIFNKEKIGRALLPTKMKLIAKIHSATCPKVISGNRAILKITIFCAMLCLKEI